MPAQKDYIKIQYPRKCEHCDYVSNNPQMYSYHKKTHAPIPEGTLCHFGCGNRATHRNTGGKHTCLERWCDCPKYLEQLAIRTEISWSDADERKEATKKSFIERLHTETVREQSRQTKRRKRNERTLEIKDFQSYSRRAREHSREWAKNQGYKLGVSGYHVDHILSIKEAWELGVSIPVVTHPANLRILWYLDNLSKGRSSDHTLYELIEKIFFGLGNSFYECD